ncbi:hypothetical protein GOV09_01525, partial [Candidatus Woesearchaeota archaeon]|nr:hypothetical protein [Candidatus Woesearchaeota archaeon]
MGRPRKKKENFLSIVFVLLLFVLMMYLAFFGLKKTGFSGYFEFEEEPGEIASRFIDLNSIDSNARYIQGFVVKKFEHEDYYRINMV